MRRRASQHYRAALAQRAETAPLRTIAFVHEPPDGPDVFGDGALLRRGPWRGAQSLRGRAIKAVGRARHDPPEPPEDEIYRPWVAGIIGAGRSWTAWTISVLSIPRRYAEVIARSA